MPLSYLRGIAEGKSFEEIEPILDGKTLQAWRESVDSEFFVYLYKRRSKAMKLKEVLPMAAHRYATEFWPYLLTCLRNRVLKARKRPAYTVGAFIPFKGSRAEQTAIVETEFFLRSRRKQLGSFEDNVVVFADWFERFKSREGLKWAAVLTTIRSAGGSESEITEALNRLRIREILRRLNDHGDLESFYIVICQSTKLALMLAGHNYEVIFETKELLEDFTNELNLCSHRDRKANVDALLHTPKEGRRVSLILRHNS